MKLLGKVTAAYLMASFTAISTAVILGLVWQELNQTQQNLWLWIAVLWLMIVGVPSLIAASNYLLKLLGVKSTPFLGVARHRLIPVGLNADFALSVASVLTPTAQAATTVDIQELEIREGDLVISHEVLYGFLRQAWRLQRQHRDGLSRNWWVDHGKKLERREYDALITVLQRHGLIAGRTRGRSGKLVMPPLSTIEVLTKKA
ncbi:MAG: hypothetical protein OES12_11590 [Anaerolineae bacterium]|nr:hypothetical protein [Anaerolineae bacterium]